MRFYQFWLVSVIIFHTNPIIGPINDVDQPFSFYENKEPKWLEESIKLANKLIDSTLNFSLVPSWSKKASNSEKVLIKVFLSKNKDDHMMFVPKGGKYILINEKKLKKYLDFYCNEVDSGQLEIDIKNICVVMLLHELGHIVNGDVGSFLEEDQEFNRKETIAKEKELKADIFAASQIKKALDPNNNHSHSLDATWISFAVTKLTWNLQKERMVDNFGATASVLWDKSYTHPNLELRFLIINNEITGLEESKDLVEDFLKRRNNVEEIVWKDN